MKIAVDFKNEEIKEEIKNNLEKRNFKIGFSSLGSMWIYELEHINYSKKSITIETKNLKTFELYLDDIEYFEVHREEK